MSPNQNQLPLDLRQTSGYTCPKCKHDVFAQGFFIRRASKLLLGTMQDQIIPVQTFFCVKCQTTLPDMIPDELKFDQAEEVKETPAPTKSIILG